MYFPLIDYFTFVCTLKEITNKSIRNTNNTFTLICMAKAQKLYKEKDAGFNFHDISKFLKLLLFL